MTIQSKNRRERSLIKSMSDYTGQKSQRKGTHKTHEIHDMTVFAN